MSTERPAAMEPSGAEECKDGIQAVTDDHKQFVTIFNTYRSTKQDDYVTKIRLAKEIVTRISQHSSAEDQELYPLIKKHNIETGEFLYDAMVSEDQVNKDLLWFLDTHTPGEGKDGEWQLYEMEVLRFMRVLEEHIDHEERLVLQPLAAVMTPSEKHALFQRWTNALAVAPKHPHPEGGSSGPAAKLVHPVAGMMDRAAHMVSGVVNRVLRPNDPIAKAAYEGHDTAIKRDAQTTMAGTAPTVS